MKPERLKVPRNVPRLAEHREDVRRAFREAHVRPQPKQCFDNALRLVIFQDVVDLLYVEGLATDADGLALLEHAWVRTPDGVDHEITSRNLRPARAITVLGRKQAAEEFLLRGVRRRGERDAVTQIEAARAAARIEELRKRHPGWEAEEGVT